MTGVQTCALPISGVVSLRGFRMLVFLAELNRLKLWGTDVCSACLEAHTKEKVCTLAGPEFGPLAGHRLLVSKALYGLCTSGQRWHDGFAACMREEGFVPCMAELDVWMRPAGDVCKCVAVHASCFFKDIGRQTQLQAQRNRGAKFPSQR